MLCFPGGAVLEFATEGGNQRPLSLRWRPVRTGASWRDELSGGSLLIALLLDLSNIVGGFLLAASLLRLAVVPTTAR